MNNLKTRQQISFSMYQVDFNLLTAHQQDMVDYEYRMQY